MTPKTFSLGAILSITTGILLCPLDDLYAIAEHMAGEPVWTHQLPRICREAAPEILRQHPDLAGIEIFELSGPEQVAEQVAAFLATLAAVYGVERDLTPLSREDHTSIDPVQELRMVRPGAEIITVDVGAGADTTPNRVEGLDE